MAALAEAPVLAVTQGDPSGIGPEITLAVWLARTSRTDPFYLLADPALIDGRARQLGLNVPVIEVDPSSARSVFARGLPVVHSGFSARGVAGRPDPEDAAGTILSIERAVEHVRDGVATAVVTNPIAKHVLHAAGFAHPGHTEFLGELAGRMGGLAPVRPVMMLWSEELAVVPVTVHVPLSAVPRLLTRDLLRETAVTLARDLRRLFGIARPRLACAGLNPHAGESGRMGREEADLIGPWLDELRADGLDIVGPLPADTMFTRESRQRYDAALAMYHDQALIPIKTLAFDEAVNVTLGLPFIRTSPDHGTAFDIAGTGKARPASLIAAMTLAARLARTAASAADHPL